MPSKNILALAFPLLLLSLVGCQSASPKQESPASVSMREAPVESSVDIPLNRTYWQVKNLMGRDVSGVINASVAFVDDKISGRAGCNLLFANFTTNAGELRVESINTTKKICFTNVMNQELLLLKCLSEAQRYTLDEAGELRIYSKTIETPVILRPISRAEMPVLAERS